MEEQSDQNSELDAETTTRKTIVAALAVGRVPEAAGAASVPASQVISPAPDHLDLLIR
jgi:hypothetical protein